MRLADKGIHDEWHFVIGNGANDQGSFYEELKSQLAPQIEALKLSSGYRQVGGLFSSRRMHYLKFGSYYSLTCAEPFGRDLKIDWYCYSTKDGAMGRGSLLQTILTITDFFTGKSKDKVIAFASVGKDCAERSTKAILAKHEEPEKIKSGNLGDT